MSGIQEAVTYVRYAQRVAGHSRTSQKRKILRALEMDAAEKKERKRKKDDLMCA